jgi:hypothetical protein
LIERDLSDNGLTRGGYAQQGEFAMTFALNLTLPIKQDAETQAKLNGLADAFETKIQPAIQEALKKSRIVHFARVVVIDNKYIQVLTEFEGDFQQYTEFFRKELTPVFAAIFSLADGAPDVNDVNGFWEYAKNHNLHSLGKATDGAKTMFRRSSPEAPADRSLRFFFSVLSRPRWRDNFCGSGRRQYWVGKPRR